MSNHQQLPNLVIAGAQKAGTSSLFWYLAQHPQICASDRKELRYFAPRRNKSDAPLGPTDEYAAHFRHCTGERYRMEATPGYIYGGWALAEALQSTLDDARVIISLRDPVTRFCSAYNWLRSRMRLDESMSIDAYLDTCERLRANGVDAEDSRFWALSGGYYADYIEAWLELFGDQLNVVFFEDLVESPLKVTTETCRWLAVDDLVTSSFNYEAENRSVAYRGSTLQRMALTVNSRAELFLNRNRGLKRMLKRAYYFVNANDERRPSLTPRQQARLTQIYAPANERLAEQLRRHGYRSLPNWLKPASDVVVQDRNGRDRS